MSKNVLWVVARLPQRLKLTLFEIFLTPLAPSGPLHSKKFQTLILAFDANSALSCENETKIVKITHSELGIIMRIFKIDDYIKIINISLKNF